MILLKSSDYASDAGGSTGSYPHRRRDDSRRAGEQTIRGPDNRLDIRLAVERAFEIICEASHRLPDEVKAKQPGIDWRAVADLGNRLRHAYHRIEPGILWEIVQRDLPPLRTFVERVIRESEG